MGNIIGCTLGVVVGYMLGLSLGMSVGVEVGRLLRNDGVLENVDVGFDDGTFDFSWIGFLLGKSKNISVGCNEGSFEIINVGFDDGVCDIR